ncbi:MAG: hypothetical protein ACRCUL_10145 [Plesiomonas sp.]
MLLQLTDPDMNLGLPTMPAADTHAAGGFAWWQYILSGIMTVIGGLVVRYFDKVVFAKNTAVSSEIREIRKLQKQGMISKEQADAKIEKLINSDSTTISNVAS